MTEWVLVVVVIALIVLVVLTSLLSSRTIKAMLSHLERARDQHHKQLGDLLDRLTAKDLEQYKTWRHADEVNEEELGMNYPDDEDIIADRPYDSAALALILDRGETEPSEVIDADR
jgi:hypothetical protein